MPSRAACVTIATATALTLSLGAGLVAALLLAASPLSTRVTAFCYTAAPLLMICVIAGGPFLEWAERHRARRARR
ncbi:hypothetical protein [Kitasatospora acidiphila]|uniref:hypothetical protein n=1 Tax=Kitasatospora acidiphila TaxID=2567942 RepID=UPI003C70D9E5